jgi:hypothetical protein
MYDDRVQHDHHRTPFLRTAIHGDGPLGGREGISAH